MKQNSIGLRSGEFLVHSDYILLDKIIMN